MAFSDQGRWDSEFEHRRALVRDVTERQARARQDEGFLYNVAKIATLGAAAGLLGRKVVRSDSFLEAMGLLGQRARAVTAPVGEFVRGAMDELAGVSRSATSPVRRFDLLETLTQSFEVRNQALSVGKTPSEVQALIHAAREGIRDRGFDNLDRYGLSRLRAATVGDVLRSNELQRAIGPQGFQVIKEASQLGMVGSGTALTRGYGGLFVRADQTALQFVDTRWISPRVALGSLYNLTRNFTIPFTGFRPADLVAGVLRPFGEGHFAGQVGRDLEIAKGIRTGAGLNFVVGGRLMRENSRGVFELAGEGLRLGRGRVGQAHLERYGNSRKLGQPKVAPGAGSVRGVLSWLQEATGIGPAYRTDDPVAKTGILDPIRRLLKGKAAPLDFVQRRENEGLLARYRTAAEAEARGIDPETLLSEMQPRRGGLTFWDKVKAVFGRQDRSAFTHTGRAPADSRDFAVPVPRHSQTEFGRRAHVPGVDPLPAPTSAGQMATPPTHPIHLYAYGGKGPGLASDPLAWVRGQAEAALDVAHHMTNRLNSLLGWTAGIGFRPSVGAGIAGGTIALGKNIAKVYGTYQGFRAGLEYLDYADYAFETTVGLALPDGWDSPKKLAIRAYQGAQLLRTGARDVVGLDNAARYFEDLMPGSMDSGLSFLARTVGPIAGGTALFGKAGLIGGAFASLLLGGTQPGKSFEEQLAEFRGERMVPVRKGRWWMLGTTPFEGGQIDRFEPHWTVRALSDYKFTDTLYGSKAEYFANVSRVPTPSNLFGLVPLLQEGGFFGGGDRYLAEKHRLTRPYPDTPGVDYDEAVQLAHMMASRGPYEAPMAAGQRLGYGSAGSLPGQPDRRNGLLGRIKDAADELSELTGAYKFLFWDLPGFGKGDPQQVASYQHMNAFGRSLWDANIGGALGMTEFLRRFVAPEEGKQGYNPIPNQMPAWLPGSRSAFLADRDYHIDFSRGDPYARVQHGEFRLPGGGYEAMYRLHSGSPGVYDPMDRFLILSDVAPHSDAYKHYKTIVEGWAATGVLDKYWAGRFDVAKKQVSERLERYKFHDRRFTGTITDPNPEITADKYNLIEKAVGGVYEVFAHDLMPKIGDAIPIFGTMATSKLFPIYSPLEHYQRFQVYGEEFQDWRNPWKNLLRPRIERLEAQDPLTAAAGGFAFSTFGASPMAALGLAITGGALLGVSSTARALRTGALEAGYVPEHRERQWELEEYFDHLQYAKSRVLEERARAVGDRELQDYYAEQRTRTTAGANYATSPGNFLGSAMRGLTRERRGYYKAFVNMPGEAQEQFLDYLPEHLKPLFLKGADRLQDPKFARYRRYSQMAADARVASYFSAVGGLPPASSSAWHPDVPMEAVKVKMIESAANGVASDFHNFNLFNEHVYRAGKFQNLDVPSVGSLHFDRDDPSDASLYQELEAAGFDNVRLSRTFGSGPMGVQWNVHSRRWDSVIAAAGRR